MNNHRLIVGGSGKGKNVGTNSDFLKKVAGKRFLHFSTSRKENAFSLCQDLYGRYDKVLLDYLPHTEWVLPVETIRRGTTEQEREVFRDQALEVLSSFIEGSLDDAPMKRDFCKKAITFHQIHPDRIPAKDLVFLFRPKTKRYRELLNQCQDSELWSVFKSLSMLHESTRLQTCGAAERLIEQAWGSEVVAVRDVGYSLDWEKLIDERWMVITSGGPGVSKAATAAIVRARNAEIVHFLEQRDLGNR